MEVGPLSFHDLDEKGHGVGIWDDREIHVPGVLPGEMARVRVLGGGQNRDFGTLVEMMSASPERVSPPCAEFDRCGGCTIQHLSLRGQHQWKMERLRELLTPVMGEETLLKEIHSPGPPMEYRSKLQWMAGEDSGGHLVLGLYQDHSHRLVPLSTCPVQDSVTEGIHEALLKHLRSAGVTSAWLRAVLVRSNGKEGLVVLIHHGGEGGGVVLPALGEAILGISGVSGVFLHQTPGEGNALLGGETRHLAGKTRLRTDFDDFSLETGPVSFVQTHLAGARALVDFVRSFAPKAPESVVDLYAGAGLFSVSLASRAGSLIAVERDGASAKDGEENLRALKREGVEMRTSDVLDFLSTAERAEVVIVDPPRAGMTEEVIEGICASISPADLIYVSCHPKSFARDARSLLSRGYQLKIVQPVDLFPHTAHVELVALFRGPLTV
jgi:23S rRNA (uracil1939-C5)-methyltransferase